MKQDRCTFEETVFVRSYLRESAAAPAAEPLPDADRIWRKAQAAARAAAVERALRPIVWARRFAFASCAAVLLFTVFSSRSRIDAFVGSLANSLTHHPSANQANSSFLLLLAGAFVLILPPLLFGLYHSWSQD